VARRTSQRQAIRNALAAALGPLTPQEILKRASREKGGLGLATVYRNLNRLETAGEVVAVRLPGGRTRYEPAGRKHHHHFQCEVCNRVFELIDSCPVAVPEGAMLAGGFRVRHHELTLYGLCPDCSPRQ